MVRVATTSISTEMVKPERSARSISKKDFVTKLVTAIAIMFASSPIPARFESARQIDFAEESKYRASANRTVSQDCLEPAFRSFRQLGHSAYLIVRNSIPQFTHDRRNVLLKVLFLLRNRICEPLDLFSPKRSKTIAATAFRTMDIFGVIFRFAIITSIKFRFNIH